MSSKSFSVVVTTWNLGHMQPGRNLKDWIPLGNDVYCIGVQESDFEPHLPFKTFHEEWLDIVNTHLGIDYCTLSHISHSHITISVHLKKSLIEHIKDVQTSTHHVTDTKGGVGIGLMLHNVSLCFISAHLAAHQFAFPERNKNINDIEKGLNFAGKLVHNFDHVFVAGDLNYRIVGINWDDSLKLITAKKYNTMLECDQLKKEMNAKNIFVGYQEGPIDFAPTFKLKTNTIDEYSPKTGDPIGIAFPSWCDRILWKNNTNLDKVQQNVYTSAPMIMHSDHKPVLATFTISF